MKQSPMTPAEKQIATEALQSAIKRAKSQALLGGGIRWSQQAIGYWMVRGFCEAEAVLPIEYVTGVSRKRLRPDLYDRSGDDRAIGYPAAGGK